jgi:XTP/dITP diphosphohydrolase
MKILLATKNQNKLLEMRHILGELPQIEWLSFSEYPFAEVTEDGMTFRENASKKARTVCAASGLATLAEDSGLEVEALGGRPGVRSARFAGEPADDHQNLEKLLELMKREPNRRARFHCVAVLALPQGREFFSEGTLEGRLASEPRGKTGFGYDPVFIPNGFSKTLAELGPRIKDRLSHRRRALEGLKETLRALASSREL